MVAVPPIVKGPRKKISLTHRQEEILDIIRHYVRTKGFSPSIREIADNLGVSSISTVHCHLLNLEKKGFIRKDPSRRRSLELVGDVDPSHREIVYVPVLYSEHLADMQDSAPLEDDPHAEVFPLSLDFVGRREAFVPVPR
jgi:repressor LexA